jgi:glycosyltransferase involved in cell wall biosynthesis
MSAHPRILFVPPRFAPDLAGGAENLIRGLALSCRDAGCHVEVATTCATDNERWLNALPVGTSVDEGIEVHRFAVDRRNVHRHRRLVQRLEREGTLDALDAADLLGTSVWSSTLQRFIDQRGPDFDAIVFAPYLFGTTFWGAQSWPERTIVIPCLHDEPMAYLPPVRNVLRSAAALALNSRGEQALAERILGPVRGGIVGLGFTAPDGPAPSGFAERHGLGRYFLYAGRIEQGKRVDVAARHVAALARRTDPSLRLAVIGRGSWRPTPDVAPFVRMIGFVDDDEKRSAMAGAVALVNPSEAESLSIVLLEAWLEETPALVATGSEVMVDHCTRSGGGVAFGTEEEFVEAARGIIGNPDKAHAMGRRGHDYVLSEYSRGEVTRRFLRMIAGLGAS